MQHHNVVFSRNYEHQEKQPLYLDKARVSWTRLWRVFVKEHSFIGPQLYMAVIHALVGVAIWATGIYTGSLAFMSYSFLVLFDAASLLIDLAPRALEYSSNSRASVEYAFGLHVLPTFLEFANGLSLLYRGIQALKEGVEHLATSSHEHALAAMEFETYAHQTPEHNRGGTLLASAMALVAVIATVHSAARFANHCGLWELCSSSVGHVVATTQMQNVMFNPFNVASVLAGMWMVYMAVLVPPAEESVIEPISCILVAVVMAAIGVLACVHLGRHLLHATTHGSAENVHRVVALVSRIPGVVDCLQFHAWSPAAGEHAGMLRVTVDSGKHAPDAATGGASVYRQIQGVLQSYGLGGWTLDIRDATAGDITMGSPGLEVAKFTFYVFAPIGFMVYFGGPSFYEKFVAADVYKFNPPPKQKLPIDTSEIANILEQDKQARMERRLAREKAMREMQLGLRNASSESSK
ncbi:hypothetical protein IW138_001963 [Coemansia sp. RSA 986]|nr:hypothetical protein IW138_001963 [Coemansia sp. RSA 986]